MDRLEPRYRKEQKNREAEKVRVPGFRGQAERRKDE